MVQAAQQGSSALSGTPLYLNPRADYDWGNRKVPMRHLLFLRSQVVLPVGDSLVYGCFVLWLLKTLEFKIMLRIESSLFKVRWYFFTRKYESRSTFIYLESNVTYFESRWNMLAASNDFQERPDNIFHDISRSKTAKIIRPIQRQRCPILRR